MTLKIPSPSPATVACFGRAMASFASHPDRTADAADYSYFPPLRRFVLERDAAIRGDFDSAIPVGWRYLVLDGDNRVVVDLDDDFDLTYSSVQTGFAGIRYEFVLGVVDEHSRDEVDCDLAVMECPALRVSALVLTARGTRHFFALSSRGRIPVGEKNPEHAFFSVVTAPSPAPARDQRPKDNGLII